MSDENSYSFLLVDDDDVFRERLARALRSRGHEVRTAADFDSAVAAAREESPERALVDLRMPGKSGLDVVRELRAIDLKHANRCAYWIWQHRDGRRCSATGGRELFGQTSRCC